MWHYLNTSPALLSTPPSTPAHSAVHHATRTPLQRFKSYLNTTPTPPPAWERRQRINAGLTRPLSHQHDVTPGGGSAARDAAHPTSRRALRGAPPAHPPAGPHGGLRAGDTEDPPAARTARRHTDMSHTSVRPHTRTRGRAAPLSPTPRASGDSRPRTPPPTAAAPRPDPGAPRKGTGRRQPHTGERQQAPPRCPRSAGPEGRAAPYL